MEGYMRVGASLMLNKLRDTILKLVFLILAIGPIPNHIAFIMDGNRRYAKKIKLKELGMGHKIGLATLLSMMTHCYQLGVKQITIYMFSIDNFKRQPEEVKSLMDLFEEAFRIFLKEDGVVNHYGVKVNFAGDLKLLDEPVRVSAQKLMDATSGNSEAGLSICVPYTSTNEITRAVEKACDEENRVIGLEDIERSLDLSVASDPDIIIRTSGETRLSNFLLWQSAGSLLCSPSVEWPEIGVRHLVWAVLKFQSMHSYFVKKNKRLL